MWLRVPCLGRGLLLQRRSFCEEPRVCLAGTWYLCFRRLKQQGLKDSLNAFRLPRTCQLGYSTWANILHPTNLQRACRSAVVCLSGCHGRTHRWTNPARSGPNYAIRVGEIHHLSGTPRRPGRTRRRVCRNGESTNIPGDLHSSTG